jgi:hypothetical protein
MHSRSLLPVIVLFTALLLTGCATTPPQNIDNACDIFREKGDWYKYSKRVFEHYGVPTHVQLAIIHQESKFMYDARPERVWILGVFPWFRPSSAYGYAQVKDETWDWYRTQTTRFGDDRDDYEDAVNFIGWYSDISHKKLGISKWDAYNLYLAYHEGQGGFQRKTYLKKPWLVTVAQKVKRRAERYAGQLKTCEASLDRGSWWWPF